MNFREILLIFMKSYQFSWNPIYFREILQITIIAIFVKSHLISWNLIVFREVLTIFMKSSNNPFPTVRFRNPETQKKIRLIFRFNHIFNRIHYKTKKKTQFNVQKIKKPYLFLFYFLCYCIGYERENQRTRTRDYFSLDECFVLVK